MEISMMKQKIKRRNSQAIDESCEWCGERCQIRNVHGYQNGIKKEINSRREMMGNQRKVVRVKRMAINTCQYNKGKSYHSW